MINGIFHNESERDYYAMVGLYTGLWAAGEASLGYLIDLIYDQFDGASVEPEKPLNLKRKLKFLKRCAKSIEALQPYQKLVTDVADNFLDEAVFRYDVLHGQKTNFYINDPHFSVIARDLDRRDRGKGQSVRTVTAEEIRARYDVFGGDIFGPILIARILQGDPAPEVQIR